MQALKRPFPTIAKIVRPFRDAKLLEKDMSKFAHKANNLRNRAEIEQVKAEKEGLEREVRCKIGKPAKFFDKMTFTTMLIATVPGSIFLISDMYPNLGISDTIQRVCMFANILATGLAFVIANLRNKLWRIEREFDGRLRNHLYNAMRKERQLERDEEFGNILKEHIATNPKFE